ncbi:MAG: transcription termination/antitermination factor NusG [Pelagibacterales bacterium]|nr:transcription termination/antitermination factor NusG [Pelagibacterales bacterium]
MENKENKWYILNVMAGQENKVASDIKSMIMRGALGQYVVDVLVPTKPVIKIKKGQKVQEMQKLFPGYVFINANINSNAYNLLNAIPKVMGFLGGKNSPEPVSETKMQEILNLSSEQASDSKNIIFDIGETLSVIEGPFESFTGTVEEFDAEKQKVKISILIFGRATSVELDINQVEKVS